MKNHAKSAEKEKDWNASFLAFSSTRDDWFLALALIMGLEPFFFFL